MYRHAWLMLVSGLLEPLFYLLSIGVGLGKLVGQVTGPGGGPVSYAAFVAPALLASSAMNGAMYDSTFNVFFRLKYAKLYDAALATPMRPADVALGEITWALIRGGLYAVRVHGDHAGHGPGPLGLGGAGVPVALLIGFAFAAVGMAGTTYMRSWQHFEFVRLADAADVPVLRLVLPAERVPGGRCRSWWSARRCTRASRCCAGLPWAWWARPCCCTPSTWR